jgi:hypothetical protein
MVRMSNVSVPEPGEKIRLGARIIAAPTPTRAAATTAKIEVDPCALRCFTVRQYSPRVTCRDRQGHNEFENSLRVVEAFAIKLAELGHSISNGLRMDE